MEKESGEGEPAVSGKPPADPLLDAAGLFSAYWGRDGGGGGGGASAAAAQAALFGFGSRYPAAAPSTLGVAANQAAQLGMHPAASAAWWSMASHLAAQDYLARLQASGLNFPPLGDPYSALSALSASMTLGKQPSKSSKAKTNDRSGRGSASSAKDKAPSTSAASSQSNMRSSYGFPKTSSPSSHSQPLSSLASLNSLVAQPHPNKSGKSSNASSSAQPRKVSSSSSSSSNSSKNAMKERDLALFRGDLMLAQAAAQGAYHAAVAAAAKGKNISPLYPFGMGTGSEKDRHGIDSLTGLPHTILSDPASVLGGVRLPPDTEIIKYTSSLASSKQSTGGSTSRGRKKTISLDPPQVSVHPASGTPLPSKRPKMEEYGSKSSVEVIRLGGRAERAAHAPSATPPPNLADYAGISRELLQTIASQSGVSLAALERQLAGTTASPESGLNLSRKGGSEDTPLDLGVKSSAHDEDAPLNLSLKPEPPSTQASDALSRLTSLSSSLNAASAPSSDRISRRKPGAKPRRVLPDNAPIADSPRPKSSGSEDSESISGWSSREGRPRNLGRGVSKPKKNTVASLLAQSRALGLRPALAHQFLAETDVEKLKTLLGETCSTDSECPSDSCPSDSDASESSRKAPNDALLRHPIALGWKRVTLIKGLSRNCNIKGDVSYSPPEPHSSLSIRSMHDLQAFFDANPCAPLTRDNFSFSPRVLLGDYVQPAAEPGETVTLGEAEITKRLEEARALAALSGARPTPPPVDKRIELARKQQAARDARRDANARSRDQARLVRELERTEKAELAKREKEARSQQLLEHINKNRTQLTIEPVPISKIDANEPWKTPETARNRKERAMPTISLTLIPVSNSDRPISDKPADGGRDGGEYNALDKMKDFAEKASFDIPQRLNDKYSFDFTLVRTGQERQKRTGVIEYAPSANVKENSLEKLIESYSRINEFINGCNWTKTAKEKPVSDPKSIERNYLDAKNKFMSQNLMLMPNERRKSVLPEIIDLSDSNEVDEEISSIAKSHSRKLLGISDATLSILGVPTAKRRKQEEMEKQKQEDQAKRQQERELKRQQAILLKEQQKYITEERERRRQHTTFIRQLDARKRWEERERRKHQNLLDRLLAKEKKLQQRRREMELLSELRRPQEDSTLSDQKPLPNLQRIPGLKLPGQAMADVLQVFEFIYNFGQTLGFDLESVPTLNTFQTALLPDCGPEAEEELMQVLTQLLVCAIEDPGIPHPGRHTTLLGHPIRMGDITNANISEILRIYLYANATGEVKSLTGLTAERERERRVADHHQTDAEMQVTCTSTKNAQYYEHLHSNSTYKLSEALRDKPFLALNATTKAKILAFLCNELLQNKAVLRQIDTSLENLNQLKKERYLMDMKIRKIKVLHQRKVRTEQAERQQALALERMQRLVEESTAESALTHTRDEVDLSTPAPIAVDHHNDTIKEALSKESSPQRDSVTEKGLPPEMQSPYKDGLEKEESDKELSPLKENGLKNKELLNNNKEECSPADNKLDKDSVMGDCDTILSDLESEGTQPEEDEDKNLSSEELARKLERLLRQSEQQLQQLAAASHALRATCYGQDRYWRRYWSLGRCGGIFVEAMESAQPEIMVYHAGLENAVVGKTEQKQVRKTGKRASREKKENIISTDQTTDIRVESQKSEDQLKSEIELKNIKSELNLSDHTQIIKYEPNLRHGACKAEGSPIKMEEKYIQHKQSKDEEDMLDIEDSIPTAFLVQKPTHKPMFATQAENLDKPQEIVKIENVVKGEVAEEQEPDESKDQLVNNLEELRKMAEAVSSQLDAAKKAENEIQEEMEKDKMDVAEPKEEIMEPEVAYAYLYTKMLEGKWFSILRKENSFLTNTNDLSIPEKYLSDYSQKIPTYVDNDQTCSEIILCQGHKWDVSNNLHLLHDPSLFTLNSMVTCVPVPANNIYADSSLTMSGLDQDMMDASLHRDKNDVEVLEQQHNEMKEENDLEKELHEDALKSDGSKLKNNNLMTLGLLNFNALSTYVTCDSPPPLQMSPDEIEQLEYCKVHGLPKKLDGNFVPKELRHGWWRITDPDQMRELLEALHPRGVRERELHAAFMQYLPTVNNKLYIDKGDLLSTDLSISHLDRVIAQNGGYPSPDSPGSYSAHTARRVDAAVLEMVEQLEERIAAASMQVKGWRPSRVPPPEEASGAELVARARHKLAAVEAHIERRYLKPPLVQSTTEAAIGAVLQAESHGNSSTPSPQNAESAPEGKENKGISRGLCTWREAVARCHTSAQLAMLVQALEAAVAWDKSIMKANCQFCLCGDNEDQLLLCDGCDKGYHTYCFKPRMEKIPDGDWYCWECVNKARGERVCIVCGGASAGRTIPCALCARAYHQDCHYPPLGKNPRGKWYCIHCAAKAPPKKPRNSKKRESKHRDAPAQSAQPADADLMVPSPAPSHASTSTTADECASTAPQGTPEKTPDNSAILEHKHDEPRLDTENGLNHHAVGAELRGDQSDEAPPAEKRRAFYVAGNGTLGPMAVPAPAAVPPSEPDKELQKQGDEADAENVPLLSRAKKEKAGGKKLQKDMLFCKNLLCEMECHEHAWPFLLPVNTKQFPQYKKVIKSPMDLSTIKRKLHENSYKCKEEFASDVRLMFSNCEVFNEDDSPVGRAGHHMRGYFEQRWPQLT